jgi:rhodanese-related sulfurtransferase
MVLRPSKDWMADLEAACPNKDAQVLFGCRSGARSAKACVAAKDAGYTNIHNAAGGFTSWVEAKAEVE